MASEMLDRVALVINQHKHTHDEYPLARLVMEAMREPTEAMLAAVVARPDALIEERTAEGVEGYAERMDAAVATERMALAGRWRAMIDAAIRK